MIKQIIELSKEDFCKGDNILRQKSNLVTDFGETFQTEVNDLIDTFESVEIAVGLAAPQIGIFKRFAVINPLKNEGSKDHLVIVNPTIISLTGSKKSYKEACLSLPGFRGAVKRKSKLMIAFQDRFGELHEISLDDFFARVVLHEFDHLEGILYVDYLNPETDLEIVGDNDPRE